MCFWLLINQVKNDRTKNGRLILQFSSMGLRQSDSEQVSTDKRWAEGKKRMSDRNGDGCRSSSSQTTPGCLKEQKQ